MAGDVRRIIFAETNANNRALLDGNDVEVYRGKDARVALSSFRTHLENLGATEVAVEKDPYHAYADNLLVVTASSRQAQADLEKFVRLAAPHVRVRVNARVGLGREKRSRGSAAVITQAAGRSGHPPLPGSFNRGIEAWKGYLAPQIGSVLQARGLRPAEIKVGPHPGRYGSAPKLLVYVNGDDEQNAVWRLLRASPLPSSCWAVLHKLRYPNR